jgi:hypothetical protein
VLLLPLTFVLIFSLLLLQRAKETKTNAKVAEVRTTVLWAKKSKG